MIYTPALILESRLLCNEVHDELMRATGLHGPMHSSHEAYGVLMEEIDEFWELVKVNANKLSPADRDKLEAHMREELIQIAAMALRTVIDIVPRTVQGNCVR